MLQTKTAANRYLWFRDDSAVIWFRMAVPTKHRKAVGKPLIAESLGTTDVREARVLAGKRRAELLEGWSANMGEAGSPPIAIDPNVVAVSTGYDEMLSKLEASRKAWPDDFEEYAARLASREADVKRLTRRLHDGDMMQWEAVADRVIAKRALTIPKGGDAYDAFVLAIAEASIDAVSVFTRRASGDLEASPRAAIVRDVKAKEAARVEPGEALLDLFEKWAAERLAKGRKRADTVNQDRKKIEQFAAFVGRDRAVDSISAVEVFEYREVLRNLPPKWTAKKSLKGLSIRDAAARARDLGLPETSYSTVNSHLSVISPLFKWLAKQPRWVGLANPCDGLFHDDVKGKNPRPPFSTDALNKLLASPLFTGFLSEGREHTPGNEQADDWRKWIVLACMFSGARVGEIAQLRISDIREVRGVWLINICEEEGEGLTVKNRKGHMVPVHSKLIALGFLAFVERQRKARGDDAQLFTGIERNSRGQWGATARWFRDYFAAIGIKNGRDGVGPHSFRHTLTDRLRSEAELLDPQIAVILDHSTKTTTGGYGVLPQGTVKMMQDWIEAVTWEGVKFDHLVVPAK